MKLTVEKKLKIYNLQQTLIILRLLSIAKSYAYLFFFSLNLVDKFLDLLIISERFDS